MRIQVLVMPVVCLVAALSVNAASAVDVKLTVADSANVARAADVVTTGVPFAKGVLKDVARLNASVAGKPVHAQFIQTVPWPDGSVRWALMDCQVDVPAGGKTELLVTDGGPQLNGLANVVKVDDTADAVKVSTGPLSFEVDKKKAKFNVVSSLRVDGKELIHGGKGLVVIRPDGGEVVAGPPTQVTVEQAGPLRAIVCAKGTFPGINNNLLQYTVRVTAYAGKKFVKLHVWLENAGNYGFTGRPEWVNFDGMYVDLGLLLGAKVTAVCEGATATGDLKVEQTNPAHRYAAFSYAVSSGAKELKKGDRTDGVVALAGETGTLTVAIRHFWQNYEKTIELVGGTSLKLWLWPSDGEWPRSKVRRGDSCGEFQQFRKPGLYALPGGVHKGYEAILDFSGRAAEATAATLNAPLMAQATPAYYAETEAAPGWFAPADFTTGKEPFDQKLKNWNRMAHNAIDTKEPTSLYAARNSAGEGRGFWYGWMDFGDLLWEPGTSSLHYDWTWTMLLNYLRQGDREFLNMGTEMVRHRIDVDQVWTDREIPQFRGLTHYEKQYTDIHGGANDGYYKPIPSHNWVSGVVLYYMLTGEPKARECALRNALGLELRQVAPFKATPNAGDQPRSTGWSILAFCHVYDLTADKRYLDDAMILFNNNFALKWEKEGPFLGNSALQYYYSVLPLVELAEHSGDDKVFKLLKEGSERPFPEPKMGDKYAEWQIHLTTLYAYVGYKTKNPDLIKKAEDLFNAYVPAAASPACYTGNGAWTKETGKTIRNGHVLQYIEWKLKK